MSTPPSKVKRKELLIPTEIIMGILSKLPTMSLLSLHCVSKQWLNILRDEYFRDLHSDILLHSRSLSESYPTILFYTAQSGLVDGDSGPIQYSINIKSPGSTSHYVIRTSGKMQRPIVDHENGWLGDCYYVDETMHCNGLLCMVGTSLSLRWPIIVCNPLTLEYLDLPFCSGARAEDSCFGFGFAPLSKQYKVVCSHPRLGAPSERPNLLVYTLGVDTTWRVVDPPVDFNKGQADCLRPVQLYANGKIFWVILGPHPSKYRLFSFDLESEQGIVIGNLPPTALGGGRDSSHGFRLALLGGRVSLFMIHGLEVEVWLLKEHSANSSDCDCLWDMRHKIMLPQIIGIHSATWIVAGIWELGEEDLLIVLLDEAFSEVCYGRISSTRHDHGQFSAIYKYEDFWTPCCGYKPSLVSLKRYGCSLGERLVDSRLSSPQNIQIPQLPPPQTS